MTPALQSPWLHRDTIVPLIRYSSITQFIKIFFTKNMMKNMLIPYYMAMQWTELYSKQHIEMRLFIYLRNEEKYRK